MSRTTKQKYFTNCSYNWLEYVDYDSKPFAPTVVQWTMFIQLFVSIWSFLKISEIILVFNIFSLFAAYILSCELKFRIQILCLLLQWRTIEAILVVQVTCSHILTGRDNIFKFDNRFEQQGFYSTRRLKKWICTQTRFPATSDHSY